MPQAHAPIVNGWSQPRSAGSHTVKTGETLYSIAFSYNKDYQELAKINQLRAPYALKPGQVLNIAKHKLTNNQLVSRDNRYKSLPSSTKTPIMRNKKSKQSSNGMVTAVSAHKTQAPTRGHWHWPARGQVSKTTDPTTHKTVGIDIAKRVGSVVSASAAGTVVYSGRGIRGYGQLLIIKHGNDWLSAYAYNQRVFVREGDNIARGQKIALMGQNAAGKPLLHFEIRHHGHPIDPLSYLSRSLA